MTSKQALDILMFAWLGRRDDKDYPDFDDIHNALYYIEQYLDRLEKLEKVVDILLNKCINKGSLIFSKNVNEYNNLLKDYSFYDRLYKEEYELLKEVL